MKQTHISRQQVCDKQRIMHTANLFGIHFPHNIEPAVYLIASNSATEYKGATGNFTH